MRILVTGTTGGIGGAVRRAAAALLSPPVGALARVACLAGGIVLSQYIGGGQGFFYQDLKDGQTTEQNERNA